MRIWLATVVGALLAMVALVYVLASSLGTGTSASVASTLGPLPALTPEAYLPDVSNGSAAAQTVSMVNFAFQPNPITITVGTTVQWTDATSSTSHTATADDGSFDSGTVNGGQTFSFTFTKTGTFGYYCRFHGSPDGSGMAGTIIVVVPTSTPTRTPTPTPAPIATP
jgi:plastocyanin